VIERRGLRRQFMNKTNQAAAKDRQDVFHGHRTP
jgi:hypothetical protein